MGIWPRVRRILDAGFRRHEAGQRIAVPQTCNSPSRRYV
jgi:hypothetical protein